MRKYYYKYNGIFVEIILYGVHLKGKGASGVQSGPKATSTHSLDGIILLLKSVKKFILLFNGKYGYREDGSWACIALIGVM